MLGKLLNFEVYKMFIIQSVCFRVGCVRTKETWRWSKQRARPLNATTNSARLKWRSNGAFAETGMGDDVRANCPSCNVVNAEN